MQNEYTKTNTLHPKWYNDTFNEILEVIKSQEAIRDVEIRSEFAGP